MCVLCIIDEFRMLFLRIPDYSSQESAVCSSGDDSQKLKVGKHEGPGLFARPICGDSGRTTLALWLTILVELLSSR